MIFGVFTIQVKVGMVTWRYWSRFIYTTERATAGPVPFRIIFGFLAVPVKVSVIARRNWAGFVDATSRSITTPVPFWVILRLHWLLTIPIKVGMLI